MSYISLDTLQTSNVSHSSSSALSSEGKEILVLALIPVTSPLRLLTKTALPPFVLIDLLSLLVSPTKIGNAVMMGIRYHQNHKTP